MIKKALYGIVLIALLLTTAGCAVGYAPTPPPQLIEGERADRGMVSPGEEVPVAPAPPDVSGAAAEIERLIIRTADLELVVRETEAALDRIADLVEELDGYIVSSYRYQYQEGVRASLTLRVPAEQFDRALDQLRGLALEVRSESISGQDVTEEYVDLQSRLRHLEATEARLLEFLEEAEDTEAALAIYERLIQIQAEIEQVKGRIQYLEESAALATINLEIIPDILAQPIQVGGWRPQGTLRNAFQALIRILQFLVDAAIYIVVLVIPVGVVVAGPWVGLAVLIRYLVRRRRRRRAGVSE